VFASPVRFARVSESSICLDAKETKDQAWIVLSQKSSDVFFYRNPSRSCFTLDSGVTPFVHRLNPYRDFLGWNYKGGVKSVFMNVYWGIIIIIK
jgi:hypothetical protein